MSVTVAHAEPSVAEVGDYLELMKPRVMSHSRSRRSARLAMLLVDHMGLFTPLSGHFPTGA
jgi:hypothetical protein